MSKNYFIVKNVMCKIFMYLQRRFGASFAAGNCNANQVVELLKLINTKYDYRPFACQIVVTD